MRKREFTWPRGVADAVAATVERWLRQYRMNRDGVVPTDMRVVGDETDRTSATVVASRYKHRVSFRLNGLQWLVRTLRLDDPQSNACKTFEKALEEHLAFVERNRGYTGEVAQWIELTVRELRYVNAVLYGVRHESVGTPAEQAERGDEIGKGKW